MIEPNDLMECQVCRFFDRSTGTDADSGECRIEPPTVARSGVRAMWPIVHECDWCGKFEPIDESGPLRESSKD